MKTHKNKSLGQSGLLFFLICRQAKVKFVSIPPGHTTVNVIKLCACCKAQKNDTIKVPKKIFKNLLTSGIIAYYTFYCKVFCYSLAKSY